ncbi:hypothetical protein TSOC_014791, partial [Tetrabaena socialis]
MPPRQKATIPKKTDPTKNANNVKTNDKTKVIKPKVTKKVDPPVVTQHIHVTRLLPRDAPDLQLHAPRGRLRVAVYAEFYPVAYKDGGVYKGLDIDIVEGFCRGAGLKPQYVQQRNGF